MTHFLNSVPTQKKHYTKLHIGGIGDGGMYRFELICHTAYEKLLIKNKVHDRRSDFRSEKLSLCYRGLHSEP